MGGEGIIAGLENSRSQKYRSTGLSVEEKVQCYNQSWAQILDPLFSSGVIFNKLLNHT